MLHRATQDGQVMVESPDRMWSTGELLERRSSRLRPGAVAQSPGREDALAWASLAQRFRASSVLVHPGQCHGFLPVYCQMLGCLNP